MGKIIINNDNIFPNIKYDKQYTFFNKSYNSTTKAIISGIYSEYIPSLMFFAGEFTGDFSLLSSNRTEIMNGYNIKLAQYVNQYGYNSYIIRGFCLISRFNDSQIPVEVYQNSVNILKQSGSEDDSNPLQGYLIFY